MPVIAVSGGLAPTGFGVRAPSTGVASLSAAQTGNGPSTNVVDRGGSVGPALLRLVTTIGATPTCTYAVEGSNDGAAFFSVQYADSASPQTLVITTFVITTATTARLLIPANIPVRFLRVTYSVNTNVTNTLDAFIY
jgi:multisubunit Na+/H+ antiporter MnhC subunit